MMPMLPRSNRHNRVGYPAALAASRLVALGTDGFPADMTEELNALRPLAREHGDDLAAAEQRLAAGQALVAEQFGGPVADTVTFAEGGHRALDIVVGGRAVVQGGRLASADLATIEAEAREAAPLVWQRMNIGPAMRRSPPT